MKRWMMALGMACGVTGYVLAQDPPPPPPEGEGFHPVRAEWGMGGGGAMGSARGGWSQPDVQGLIVERLLGGGKVAEELGLTEEQVNTLRTDIQTLRKEMIDLRAELEKNGLDQARLMTDKTLDETALMAAVEKAGAINTSLAKARIRQVLLLRKTLTPEQMEKARDMMHRKLQARREGPPPGGDRMERRGPDRESGDSPRKDVTTGATTNRP